MTPIPILMLVPYFAPQTHAAMFRAHKLAKYLPRVGYRPIIVTTGTNYLYNEDDTLLAELVPGVDIHRARHVEPTLRGLRMMMGGRDRTFAAMKRSGAYAPVVAEAESPVTSPSAGNLMAEAVRVLGEWPDRHWTWSISARTLCRRLIREHDIQLIYTSAAPASPLLVARSLQREFGLRWVADFRDPVGYGKKYSSTGMVASAIERHIIAETMRHADMVTGLARSYGSIFFDLFGLPEDRYQFIPTGLDEDYLAKVPSTSDQRKVLLHVGEVMPNQSPHAFSVLARAHVLQPEFMSRYSLEFVGRREINEPRVGAITSALPVWPFVTRFIDHLPQAELYSRIRAASACLLIPGSHRYWWTNFAKMVDYIAMSKPVIADVPVNSESRTELTRAGIALFLGGANVDCDAAALLAWLQRDAQDAPSGYGARYTAARQAADFASVFERLRDGRNG